MVLHSSGGGIEMHVRDLARRFYDRFNTLMLIPNEKRANLVSICEATTDQRLDYDTRLNWTSLIQFLRDCNVVRLHIHHISGHEQYLHRLIGELDVPFDITVHDYVFISANLHLVGPDDEFVGDNVLRSPEHESRIDANYLASTSWLVTEAEKPNSSFQSRRRSPVKAISAGFGMHRGRSSHALPANCSAAIDLSSRSAAAGGCSREFVLSPHKGDAVVIACADWRAIKRCL